MIVAKAEGAAAQSYDWVYVVGRMALHRQEPKFGIAQDKWPGKHEEEVSMSLLNQRAIPAEASIEASIEGIEPVTRVATQLFLVESRLPIITTHELNMLLSALAEASQRLSRRGQPVRLLRSNLLPLPGRLLCWFEAESDAAVRTVNESAQAPFTSLEVAFELLPPSETVSV